MNEIAKKPVSQDVFNAMVRDVIFYGPMNRIKNRLEELFQTYAVLAPTETGLTLLREEQGPLDPNGNFTLIRTYMRAP